MSFRRRSEGLGRAKVACDACRHKKAKCDGLVPCTRCRDGRNDDICCYSRRIESSEQVFSALYVKMLRRQLHITLSSLRFLVERIAMEKDCRVYVPDIDTPINTVINLIQESPEFDEEQGKEFSEMSDSELTMLSPQELPSQAVFNDDMNEEAPVGHVPERKAKSDHAASKIFSSHKRKSSDADHDSDNEAPAKPTRGRPKKVKRTQSSEASHVPVASTSTDMTSYKLDHHGDTNGSQPPSADSTPLTPVSVRSDTGEDSPLQRATYPKMLMLDQGNHTATEQETYSISSTKAPVFTTPDYHSNPLSHGQSELEGMSMENAMEEGPLAPQMPLERLYANQVPDLGARVWSYQARLPYETPSLNDHVSELDFFAVDECGPSWPVQVAAVPPTVVSLNDLEYQMPR